jgi:ABC-2 type transport system ATP-binding protein
VTPSSSAPYEQGVGGVATGSTLSQGVSAREQAATTPSLPFARGGEAVLPQGIATQPLLVFHHVSKWYGPVIGLNEVTLELGPGITGLVGPNGAGKSTLMKLATGQLRPSLGRVTIRGIPTWHASARRHLGYCPEADTFYEEMSGRQFVVSMARLFGYRKAEARERTEAALQRVGMVRRADRRLRGYSKGMRQRIKLAQALVHDPDLLILDEPLNGVDPLGRMELDRLFRELADQGKSILISSHQLEELERLTDRVMVVARGKMIVQGTLSAIRDLLDYQPLAIRIDSDRPRELAAALLKLPEVLGVELADGATVIARARNPQNFFRAFNGMVLDEAHDITHLETLDSSAQAILDYLLKGNR